MKLWLLTYDDPDWEEHWGFVVRAEDEASARCEAMDWTMPSFDYDRGPFEPWWGDPDKTTCAQVGLDDVGTNRSPGVILASSRG